MGMYTAIKAEIPINYVGRQVIGRLHSVDSDANPNRWSQLTEFQFAVEYGKDYRANFVPFGVGSMPAAWENEVPWSPINYVVSGVWRLWSAVKNYEGTLEKFINGVVPHITDRHADCKIWTWYEEDDRPSVWTWDPDKQVFDRKSVEAPDAVVDT